MPRQEVFELNAWPGHRSRMNGPVALPVDPYLVSAMLRGLPLGWERRKSDRKGVVNQLRLSKALLLRGRNDVLRGLHSRGLALLCRRRYRRERLRHRGLRCRGLRCRGLRWVAAFGCGLCDLRWRRGCRPRLLEGVVRFPARRTVRSTIPVLGEEVVISALHATLLQQFLCLGGRWLRKRGREEFAVRHFGLSGDGRIP